MSLHVLYTARNRFDFVKVSFQLLLKYTAWKQVDKIVVYDDDSRDGTAEWLERKIVSLNRGNRFPPIEYLHTKLKSPPAIMNHFLGHTDCDVFAKIDSDIACPPGWLDAMLGVMERNPEVELLGMEAGQTWLIGRDGRKWDGVYHFKESTHIGGVGLMKTERFRHLPPIPAKGFFGWTEHQDIYRWVRGWIEPDLLVPQLDRIPVPPYQAVTFEHRTKGWSRPWPFYSDHWGAPYYDWVLEEGLL